MTRRKVEETVLTASQPGEVVDVPDPAVITLPNGQEVKVTGGRYVIEFVGEHKVKG
jgi:hypothetical protein